MLENLYKRAWKLDFETTSYEDIKSGIESTLTKRRRPRAPWLAICTSLL